MVHNLGRDAAQQLLYTHISNGDVEGTAKLLLDSKIPLNVLDDYDLDEGEGILFGMAFKHSSELVQTLLSYYVDNYLQAKNQGTLKYIAAERKLKLALTQQKEEHIGTLPKDIQSIITPWRLLEEDLYYDEQDLDGFEYQNSIDNSGTDNAVLGDGNEQFLSLSKAALAHHNSTFDHAHNSMELLGSA